MKHLHRAKAIEAYKGAKLVLAEGMVYPAYMLLKESLRGTLAYINEDRQGKSYSEKTKLRTLLEETPMLIDDNNTEVFNVLLDLEQGGLEVILSTEVETLKKVKKVLKKLIGLYLGENL